MGHRSRRWEPEPLRYAGVRGITTLMGRMDRREDRTGRPAKLAGLLDRFLP